MPIVDIKGIGRAKFPDNMPREDIKSFLQNKYSPNLASTQQTIEPVNTSLGQDIGQSVADFLFDKGVITDRYRAQQIGKKISTMGEFLPGIGDAAAGDEFGTAVAKGDKFGMAIGALGAIPIVGDVAKKFSKVLKVKEIQDVKLAAKMKAHNAGFLDLDLFHGTNQPITAFSLDKGGDVSGSPVGKLGISVALNRELAEEFSMLASKHGGDPQVIKLVHRAKKPVRIDLDGTETNFEIAATVKSAWEQDFDSIMFTNYTSPSGSAGNKFLLVRDPSQLRKPSAKFDIKEKLNPSLLAGFVGAALLIDKVDMPANNEGK